VKNNMLKQFSKTILPLLLLLLLFVQTPAQSWITVRSESRFNFSGMALVEQTDARKTFIVVHDNKDQFADAPKKNKTERTALLIVENGESRPRIEPLKWFDKDGKENALPVDLESVSAIPDQPNKFLAGVGNPNEAGEKGAVYYVELAADKKSVRVLNWFKLPTQTDGRDFEAFAVQKIGDKLFAFWADRGKNEKPATLFWGEIDLQKGEIKSLGETNIKTPDLLDLTKYPKAELRSISDLKIDDSGGVFVTSALDGEDYGIFASAFYYVGAFAANGATVSFKASRFPVKLYQFKNYKTEAFEFIEGENGGVIFGTDDEDFGASIFFNW